jgi:hypothetical protein
MDQGLNEAIAWYDERVAAARDLFLGVLTHDLRTPLGAVLGSAELLLRDESLSSTATKAAVRISNSARRMSNMISDLLDFMRTRLGGHLPVEVSRFDLASALTQTIEELRAFHPGADIRYECEGDLKGDWDVNRLCQLLSNLVGNAVQHGDPSKPVVVSARSEDDSVVASVHNEGPAIAPEMIGKIFDPMMRGVVQEAERRSRSGSLGLGLYICRQIAKAHGGSIGVSSSTETGTTFVVRLPRTRKQVGSA